MVGSPGFEPGISRTRTANLTKLDHDPKQTNLPLKSSRNLIKITAINPFSLARIGYEHEGDISTTAIVKAIKDDPSFDFKVSRPRVGGVIGYLKTNEAARSYLRQIGYPDESHPEWVAAEGTSGQQPPQPVVRQPSQPGQPAQPVVSQTPAPVTPDQPSQETQVQGLQPAGAPLGLAGAGAGYLPPGVGELAGLSDQELQQRGMLRVGGSYTRCTSSPAEGSSSP